MARRNIEHLLDAGVDAVVNAAGCGAAMKEYGYLLREEFPWPPKRFSALVNDASEFLAGLGLVAIAR